MTIISPVDTSNVRFRRDRAAALFSGAFLLVFVLTALRVITAAWLPLSFDESYFWLWSRRLAISYFEHPPLIAFAIRAGTFLLGDTELGVRLASLLASVAASWALWRAAATLLADRARAWTACVYFNATLMIASQGMAATPDIFVVTAAAFLLLSVAQLQRTQHGRWWLAAGASIGLAMLAKYTAFFLGFSVALWTVTTPQGRHWLRSPWPYAAAVVALLCLVPNLVWNDAHDWMSFKYQFGRVLAGKPGFRYAFEFIAAQLALASPAILALAGIGLAQHSRPSAWREPVAIAVALVWPAILYFAIHCLHDRVQGNWPSFVYPGVALLAASIEPTRTRRDAVVDWCRWLALPIAALVLAVAYLQTWTGVLPAGKSDPVARMTAVGLQPVVQKISAIAQAEHAAALVTSRYVTSGWLAFYVRPGLPIVQVTEPYRWSDAPIASPRLLESTLLYITQRPDRELREVKPYFSVVKLQVCIPRIRSGVVIDSFCVYRLTGFHSAQPNLRGAIVFMPGSTTHKRLNR